MGAVILSRGHSPQRALFPAPLCCLLRPRWTRPDARPAAPHYAATGMDALTHAIEAYIGVWGGAPGWTMPASA